MFDLESHQNIYATLKILKENEGEMRGKDKEVIWFKP